MQIGKTGHHVKTNLVPGWQIVISLILLVGLVILGYGYYLENRVAFYLGLMVTVGGVLTGIIQLTQRGGSLKR